MSPRFLVGSPSAIHPIQAPSGPRLDYLDATRAFALGLGVVFHATLSFSPQFMGWAVQDISTSTWISVFFLVSHSFRMELFFLLAGFFSQGTVQRHGAGEFLRSRAVRIGVPFVAGWFLLWPLITSGWIMGAESMRGDYEFWKAVRAGFANFKTSPVNLFTGSHLWFLYYLLLITGLMLTARGIVQAADRTFTGGRLLPRVLPWLDSGVAWLARSAWALPALAIPTAGALWGMHHWGVDTPDQSLWPHWPVVALYGCFFGLGWMFRRQSETISTFARVTASRVILAVTSALLTIWLSALESDPSDSHYRVAHTAFTFGYAVQMWTLVALTLGIFRAFCSRPRAAIRYLADSSYWIYLIHLPVVVWLQVAVAEIPFHWLLKLAFVSAVAIGLGLLTYDLFVRPTILGQLLNGRRREGLLSITRWLGP